MASAASSGAGPSKTPVKPPVVQPASGNAIIINPCQRLNPVLEHIKNVSKEFGDIIPDFQLGRTTCALFLSLKYHRLHPEYVHQRIQKLSNTYNLRILLIMCDVGEHQELIRELTKICIVNNITVMVCWSAEEAGIYLASYKAFEYKSPDIIKERQDKEYHSILRSALTTINKVNKTDVETLRTTFGSFRKISKASPDQFRSLPGFGPVKVRRIKDAFEKPFRNNATSTVTSSEFESHVTDREFQISQPANSQRLGGHPPTAKILPGVLSSPSKGTYRFGSAADMPPPPVPPLEERESASGRAASLSTGRRQRSLSPVWDIELDLNEDE